MHHYVDGMPVYTVAFMLSLHATLYTVSLNVLLHTRYAFKHYYVYGKPTCNSVFMVSP